MGISKLNPSAGGIPFGDNDGRPANASIGRLYSNGEEKRLELYTESGWQNIVSETPGVVSVVSTNGAVGATTLQITGTNFTTGAVASVIGTNGVEVNASATTVNSIVSVTATFSDLSYLHDPYDVKVTNTSNLFGLLPDAFYINQSPSWVTAAGSLGTFTELVSISVSATASDPESQTITYALASGSSLPSGISLNSSTGAISGTLPAINTNTTYSFTINATDGTNTVPRTFSITSSDILEIDYLVVAGGGGGGGGYGGGGGAGGFRTSFGTSGRNSSAESKLILAKGTNYTVTVGNGGAGGVSGYGSANGSNGSNSVFSTITSTGGGGGGNARVGSDGGSGGGTMDYNLVSNGTSGQGFGGGIGTAGGNYGSGGGGGAGAAGVNGTTSVGGNGGAGIASTITGSSVTYAGGGGGATYQGGTAGAGGAGGGGAAGAAGTNNPQNGNPGTANTGGGGGGASAHPYSTAGGAGGSGVVILRWRSADANINVGSGLTADTTGTDGTFSYKRITAGTGNVSWS
jgi:hypothetical protein